MKTQHNTSKQDAKTVESATQEFTIDAKGMRIGRIASQAAALLNGKSSVKFSKNLVTPVRVQIINASQIDISEKRTKEVLKRYSGYPSGQKLETFEHLAKRRGYGELLKRVIAGMVPKNRLHKPRLKNLVVSE